MNMSKLANEELKQLGELREHCPARRNGEKPNLRTLSRWCLEGLKGQRLECLVAGGVIFSSRPALDRFFQRLTELRLGQAGASQQELVAAERRAESVGRELIAPNH